MKLYLKSINDEKVFEEIISAQLKGLTLNMQTTYLDIKTLAENADKEWYKLEFSATNNGKNYSDKLVLMVYPSKSYTCNLNLENFYCNKIELVKVNSSNSAFNFNFLKFALFCYIFFYVLYFL